MIENLLCLGFISLYIYGFVMCNLSLKAFDIYARVILSTQPACDVYVRLKTSDAAIKIARETTNNQ